MGHHVNGLVAGVSLLARIAVEHGLPAPTRLEFADLALLPLDAGQLDGLADVDFAESIDARFTFLSPSFLDWIARCSRAGDVLYIETEYFGGTGVQGAVHCREGALVANPAHGGIGIINAALASIGVPNSPTFDAFDLVGLSTYRTNAECRAANHLHQVG